MQRPLLTSFAPAAIALFLTACSGGTDTPTDRAALPTVEVQVAEVQSGDVSRPRHLPATVQAAARATLGAQVMGTVVRVPAIGQSVQSGETLVTLAADALVATVAQARAALDLATRNHQREADLLTRGAATAEAVRALDDQRRIAVAQLEAAAAQLAHTTVTAPFAGRITARHVEPGDLAAPGTPLVSLAGDTLEVEVGIPESLAPPRIGDPATVVIHDQLLPGTIRETSAAADPTTRTRLTRITLPADAPAHPGQFVHVPWPDQTIPALTVPASTVTVFGQMERVFLVADGHAHLRLVRTAGSTAGATLVLAGLNPGETVVINPPATLRDGSPVTVSR